MKRRCIPLNKFIFRRKPSEKKEQSLLRLLLPSVLGFALCFVCLAATTWAWFVVSVTSNSNTIQTASFEVEVAVFDSNGDLVPANTDGSYTVSAGGTYTVALQKTGNAEKVYFLIKDGDTEYYTGNLAGGDVQYLFERAFTNTNVTITPKWGEAPNVDQDKRIEIGSPLALLNEDPANETQQEEEQENQQQEEENPSDKQSPADDPENNGEGENTSTDTPDDGEGGQPSDPANGENGQQPSEPSTPAEGEGEQPDVSGETTGGDTGDDTVTGGETPTDTTTPTGGDVSTDPVATTDPAPTE